MLRGHASAKFVGMLCALACVGCGAPRVEPTSPVASTSVATDATPAAPPPQAEVPEKKFSFGVMTPLTEAAHDFVVRNTGQSPLTLELGETTCRCTLSKLATNSIPPGGSTTVRLEWSTNNKAGPFAHSAEVFTNDPKSPKLVFQIQGAVKAILGADREAYTFLDLVPNRSSHELSVFFSHAWPKMKIVEVRCDVPGVTWEIAPAPAAALQELNALSGHEITLNSPPDLASGRIDGILTVRAEPELNADGTGGSAEPQENQVQELSLPVFGTVKPAIAIIGGLIDTEGLVDFGTLKQGAGTETKMLLKVRDNHRTLNIQQVEVEPPVMEVSLKPQDDKTPFTGMYSLVLRVPASTPAGSYSGATAVQVRLHTDHPTQPLVRLQARFLVVGGD